MSIKGSASNLQQSLKNMMLEWEQTKASWRDVKSQQFEEKYLADLPGHVTRAGAVMEELDALLKKVRNDCE